MKGISIKNMKRTRRVALLAGVFFAATAILGGTALASTVLIKAGNLTITTPTVGNFADVTMNGAAQNTQANVGTWDVIDARGSGAGWNVTVQATQFDSGSHQLALGSLQMTAPGVAAKNGTSNAAPTIVGGPYTIDAASAVKIASAAVNTGMGSYTFTPAANNLTLSIPASAYVGTYTSTVTVSVVTGP